MDTLNAMRTSFPATIPYLTKSRRSHGGLRYTLCFCGSNGSNYDDSSPSSPSEGDRRKQELLARIAMLQTQKVRLTDFLDERSAFLTQFAEDANVEFDQIGDKALKELDEASARIMEKLESRAQAFEETSELNKQEIERNEEKLQDFEDQMERDRNEGLFFKNLGAKVPEKQAEAKVETQKLKELTREAAGSKTRRSIYLGLIALLGITITNIVVSSPEVEWRKVVALMLILMALLAQFIYELSMSSAAERTDEKDW